MRASWLGTGTEVVLLHGQPGSAADWSLVVPHLAGLRLLVPTRRGYDGTPPGGFADNARDVVDLMDQTGVDRVVVAGHSWGGGVALQLAADHPSRVSALCLLGSVGSARALTRTDRVLALGGVRHGSAGVMRTTGSLMARLVAASAGSRLDGEQRRLLQVMLTRWATTGAWRTFAYEQAAFVRDAPALAERLGEVLAPALVVVGSRDSTVSAAAGTDLADRLPAADHRELDCGHLMPLEVPGQVAAAVRDAVALAG